MGRIISSGDRGDSLVEWHMTDGKEAANSIANAEQVIAEARASGCVIAKKVNGELVEVLDQDPFDPGAEEYRVFDPQIDK